MTTRNGSRLAGRNHANPAPSAHPPAGKSSDPVLEDALLGATALCAELVTDDLATLARAGEFSPSWASEIRRNGGRGSFIHKTTVLTYRLANRSAARAWALVAHLKTTLKAALMPTTDAELVLRFWELMDAEADCEGRENTEQGRLARSRDLEALKRATLAEAAVQEELAAVIQELQRRRIDPFEQQKH
jgi:hypothetical protein